MSPADDMITAAVVHLARANIPTDIQELLIAGNPMMAVAPNALEGALEAAMKLEPIGWAKLNKSGGILDTCQTATTRQNWISHGHNVVALYAGRHEVR